MQLINYAKYEKKWSPRSAILLAVFEGTITGFFLAFATIEAIHRHSFFNWVFPLTMGFASAVAALQSTLVALHHCTANGEDHFTRP